MITFLICILAGVFIIFTLRYSVKYYYFEWRVTLNDKQLYLEFCKSRGLPLELIIKVLKNIAEGYGISYGKLRAHDKLDHCLHTVDSWFLGKGEDNLCNLFSAERINWSDNVRLEATVGEIVEILAKQRQSQV